MHVYCGGNRGAGQSYCIYSTGKTSHSKTELEVGEMLTYISFSWSLVVVLESVYAPSLVYFFRTKAVLCKCLTAN